MLYEVITAVDPVDHLPAVGAKPCRGIIGEPAFHVTVDGDAVVIPEGDQFAEPQGAGQGTGLVGDAFHQATIPHEGVGVMVDDLVPGAIELGGQGLFRQRHAHRIGDALSERAGGGFHAGRIAQLRMAGGPGVQLTETLQFAP